VSSPAPEGAPTSTDARRAALQSRRGGGDAPAVATRADFSAIRYAQCWEDADILVEALAPRPGHTLVSICSAGDNTLALLTGRPSRVVAVDLSAAQIACLELRVAAYRALSHPELLQLVGSRPCGDRRALYRRCRSQLSTEAQAFWDAHGDEIDAGIGGAGKFERYFALFRQRVLPLVHSRSDVERLLTGAPTPEARERFYQEVWNTWRWRGMFQVFFSRLVMGRLGRDPEFFAHVEGSVAARILSRTHHALTVLNPAENPYIHWILRGTHGDALPMALRAEHFDTIRDHLDRLTWQQSDVAAALDVLGDGQVHGANLSDIFEYMSVEETRRQLERLCRALAPGGRLAYWNMLAPRRRPQDMAGQLHSLDELATRLFAADKAFFYSAFVVEERR
jgi:S-adenosylmethionine-diacylglycerol 3-amino-3-carboxypropyl transferase